MTVLNDNVWFTSDLHLGSFSTATKHRKFESVSEHDDYIIDRINSKINKRTKLYILGDVAFTDAGLKKLLQLKCENIEIILGNHDKHRPKVYLDMGIKIHGFKKYKKYWLSHCPIHPNELYRCHGNIHGHVHASGRSETIVEPGYFNANIDVNDYYPIPFCYICDTVKLTIQSGDDV